ncbi:uncharacterized protein LOC117795209 [Ailuropoda melanoleuca]|uniref:uncharacterized protein LOC117795209 n=1 Tax=Ailuropoda melanoleuca TaxID=9646 RepID=UPI001494EBCF|nr:uncharacterized protein LOC117795209 [Ailuropoda melanoleuca]XP_034494688.1 uncharacterized protein LOC117795209 [Ailuropoda melanoleuca]XP_034494689.1 uncharacterized protein LOC117795209 [Ailuropoda melanoleuca]XP_034494690.1 uncharacterized protein LOC117795209 [Ailuropoda melanoleuca]XP_034494691.1 uncharacterized protein LOC117795209 [Ailuropoda melanoleuca]XP_034494692.1 uncharacterized protein LOC117795209 [Ailuropoda melanoleuca]
MEVFSCWVSIAPDPSDPQGGCRALGRPMGRTLPLVSFPDAHTEPVSQPRSSTSRVGTAPETPPRAGWQPPTQATPSWGTMEGPQLPPASPEPSSEATHSLGRRCQVGPRGAGLQLFQGLFFQSEASESHFLPAVGSFAKGIERSPTSLLDLPPPPQSAVLSFGLCPDKACRSQGPAPVCVQVCLLQHVVYTQARSCTGRPARAGSPKVQGRGMSVLPAPRVPGSALHGSPCRPAGADSLLQQAGVGRPATGPAGAHALPAETSLVSLASPASGGICLSTERRSHWRRDKNRKGEETKPPETGHVHGKTASKFPLAAASRSLQAQRPAPALDGGDNSPIHRQTLPIMCFPWD